MRDGRCARYQAVKSAANKLAIEQVPPVFMNRQQTLERAVNYIDKAAAQGAKPVVFPEAFIPGYPAWIWRLRPGSDRGQCEQLHARLLHQAVDVARGDLVPLYDVARRNGVTVLCGMNELDSNLSRSTLYNSYVVVGADGRIKNHHRKLMPMQVNKKPQSPVIFS